MNKDINGFYSDLWNNEEEEKDKAKTLKFEEEEKDINLFNQRLKEDLEEVENIENPFIQSIVLIREFNISCIKQAKKDIKRDEKGY